MRKIINFIKSLFSAIFGIKVADTSNKQTGENKQKEEQIKKESSDPNEDIKYVCHGGKVQCKYCNPPFAEIIVTTETIMLQDKPWATVGDKDGKKNFGFMGVCMHPSQQKLFSPPPPCKGVISLGQWKDFSETIIGNHSALLVKSTIPCMISGEDLKIIHSGQMATSTQISPLEKKDDTPVALELTKVSFNTKFDICSDDVKDFNDYKNFWILDDKESYYHWLKERSNTNDSQKPEKIPITFVSSDKISFKATFKVAPKNNLKSAPLIKVTDKSGNYSFNVIKGKTDEEFEMRFESTNTPFNGKVGYIEVFELLFEYSQDNGQTWKEAGVSANTLYVTWKSPLYTDYFDIDDDGYGGITIKVRNTKNRNKASIVETLLWLGCYNAINESIDDNIVDDIFKPFATKRVERVRETTWKGIGLGYWRGKSSLSNSASDFSKMRSLRYLLREGEARCGEWTNLFLHLLLTQGIKVSPETDTIAICTEAMCDQIPYFKNNYIYGSSNKKIDICSMEFSVVAAKFIMQNYW